MEQGSTGSIFNVVFPHSLTSNHSGVNNLCSRSYIDPCALVLEFAVYITLLNVDVDNRITSILLSTRKISKGYNYKGSLLALGGSEWVAGAFLFLFCIYIFFFGGGE